MTALDTLPDYLRAWGLDVVAVTGWQDRGRPGPFNPIGVLVHHTAAPGPKDAPSLQVCIDGRRDLPGPLCQLLVARSGKVYVISASRCNHAGTGGPLAGVIGVDQGNTQLVGLEAENDGVSEPWPPKQLDAMAATAAAVLDLLGRPRAHCWAHREYTPRKPDPRGIDMGQFRSAVAIARPPGATTVPTPPTANPYPTETAEALELLAQHAGYVGDRLWFGPDALAALHRLKNAWVNAESHVQTIQGEAADLRKTIATNADTITRLAAERDHAEQAHADAVANREAAEAEVAQLRRQLQEGGRLPTLLADLDTALVNLTKLGAGLDAAIAKARA